MADGQGRKRRKINLRRSRATEVSDFAADDKLRVEWDRQRREWNVVVESANGLSIRHFHLTDAPQQA